MIIRSTDQCKCIGKLDGIVPNHQLYIGVSTDFSIIFFPNEFRHI